MKPAFSEYMEQLATINDCVLYIVLYNRPSLFLGGKPKQARPVAGRFTTRPQAAGGSEGCLDLRGFCPIQSKGGGLYQARARTNMMLGPRAKLVRAEWLRLGHVCKTNGAVERIKQQHKKYNSAVCLKRAKSSTVR